MRCADAGSVAGHRETGTVQQTAAATVRQFGSGEPTEAQGQGATGRLRERPSGAGFARQTADRRSIQTNRCAQRARSHVLLVPSESGRLQPDALVAQKLDVRVPVAAEAKSRPDAQTVAQPGAQPASGLRPIEQTERWRRTVSRSSVLRDSHLVSNPKVRKGRLSNASSLDVWRCF